MDTFQVNHSSNFVGYSRRKMNTLVAISVITIYTQLQFSNAAVLNRTDQYHILPIPVEELEHLRAARQETVPELSVTLSPDLATNVAQILTGLLNEDVMPIVQGGAAFIPVGGVREGVQALLHGLSPLLQNVLFGPYQPPSQPQQSPVTAAPPAPPSPTAPTHIQIVIQLNSDSQFNSSIAKTTTTSTTTPVPTTTTEQPEATTPFGIILRYRIKNKPSTTPSPSTPPGQMPMTKVPKPSQILLFFRHPNETSIRFPQSSFLPESPKLNSHLPDSPMLGIMNIDNYNALLPESPMSSVIKHIIENKQAEELLKQVDEDVITSISTTEKQYIYLVLQNEEYEEFAKFTSQNRMSSQPPLPQVAISNNNVNNDQVQQQPLLPALPPTVASVVTSTSSPSTTTTSGSTTIDPDPKVKEDEDDDDDDRISITDILDAVISRRV